MKSLMIATAGAFVLGASALTPVPAQAQTYFSFGVQSGPGYGYYDRGYYGPRRGWRGDRGWRGNRGWRGDRRGWRGNGRWNRAGYYRPGRVVCRYDRFGYQRCFRR